MPMLAANLEQFPLAHGGHVLTERVDFAGIRLDQAQSGLQQHRFAAARGAQNDARFAFVGLEGQFVSAIHVVVT